MQADINDNRSLDQWSSVTCDVMVDAKTNLLLSLLAWKIEGDPFCSFASSLPGKAMKPRGVLHKDKIYLAIQEPDDDTPLGEESSHGCTGMRLAILDAADLFDLEVIDPATGGEPAGADDIHLAVPGEGEMNETSTIEAAAATNLASKGRLEKASRALDHHERGAKLAELALQEEEHVADEAEADLIRAIREASPRELPDDAEWYSSTGPLWQASIGGKVYALSRGRPNGSCPCNMDEAVKNVALTIIDLASIGGVH